MKRILELTPKDISPHSPKVSAEKLHQGFFGVEVYEDWDNYDEIVFIDNEVKTILK